MTIRPPIVTVLEFKYLLLFIKGTVPQLEVHVQNEISASTLISVSSPISAYSWATPGAPSNPYDGSLGLRGNIENRSFCSG